MAKITIDHERCKGCSYCAIVCPVSNIRMSDKLNNKGYSCAEIIDEDKCTGCGLCFRMCPDLCIEIGK
ncbi:4Fe-4S binding protein [Candidatus Woesearchaeota archaeon]|nr:4Fe-4S binding protein [Candidatus Woesearchaeota archaeon]